jgi:ubiquinone/menaquinone biosynthesis C-methylase UbiE
MRNFGEHKAEKMMKIIKKTEWQNNKYYDLGIQEYMATQKKLLSLLDGVNGARLLDIGCGEGQFTIECANLIHADEVYGIEIRKNIAKEAKRKGIKVIIGDASQTFPFATEYFDVIMANQILEHVLDTDNMLNECHRILKVNGVMLLAIPNLCSLLQRILVLFGQQPTTLHVSEIQVGNFLKGVGTYSEHIHAFAPPALKDLLEYHNFSIDKICGSGFYPLPLTLSIFASRLFPKMAVYLIAKVKKDNQNQK